MAGRHLQPQRGYAPNVKPSDRLEGLHLAPHFQSEASMSRFKGFQAIFSASRRGFAQVLHIFPQASGRDPSWRRRRWRP